MSRSGYDDGDGDKWELIRWRGAVASAINGKRGQAFLKEMLATLDMLEAKRLIAHELVEGDEVCAIGTVGKARGIDMSKLDPEDSDGVAAAFGISAALAREIVFTNDEAHYGTETPEQRYERMRKWTETQIRKAEPLP